MKFDCAIIGGGIVGLATASVLTRGVPSCSSRRTPKAGVRAQALIVPGQNMMHVCNAPSPAATASLEIGKAIAEQVPVLQTAVTVQT